ncbi:hypothetical protein DM860_001862 [Cuscuta australis]|uniref:AT-hook motif nuclear-localized protein n=1 Tax=Cuscuta australis TaxID=267555 RepID=A0A328E9U4_9ASTE|nr:hypothetical protein DM860_001862 [Cuscuta australis]
MGSHQDSQPALPNHLHHHPPPQSHFQDPQHRRSPGHPIMACPPHHPNYNPAAAIMQQQQPQGVRLPFNSSVGSGMAPKPPDYSDGGGSSPPRASSSPGFPVEPVKKNRGRPRKFSPESNIALGLSPAPVHSVVGHSDSGAGIATSSENQTKKYKGRPPGSVKKQKQDPLGSAGVSFTPHVLTVNAGEDISQKIMAFSQQGPRTVCVLSANGTICNVTLRQPASCGGTVTLEGRFEIISLSGSFMLSESESNASRSRSGGLSVSLAGADGRVMGGGVSGMLIAASPVQVVVCSFITNGSNKGPTSKAASPTPPPLDFGRPGANSPPSEGGSSESEEEEIAGSPTNRRGPTPYGHPAPMYVNMGWPNSM